jgi:hypothetical protein
LTEEWSVGMKQLVVGIVLFLSLFPAHSGAQHGGGGHGGGFPGGIAGRGGFRDGGFTAPGLTGHSGFRRGHFGLPTVRPIPQLGSVGIYNRFWNYGSGSGGLGWGYPNAFDSYGDEGYDDSGYQSPMISTSAEENYGPTFIQPPPPPARPELHEYKWPDSSGDAAATFVLMLTDGSVRPAIAVWVQESTVHYITPEGSGERLELHNINRQGTRMSNAAKHLTLWLPAGS